MASIETEQVRLRLTEDKEVLDALRSKGRLKRNPSHPRKREELVIQFDAKPFHFAAGEAVIVGRRVANGLRRDSAVIIGDPLTGEVKTAVEEIGSYDMTQGYEEQRRAVTDCPVCTEKFETVADLGKHLIRDHRQDRPDLYITPAEGKELDMRKDRMEGKEKEAVPLADSQGIGA